MKTIEIKINGEYHEFEIDNTHDSYLDMVAELKDLSNYPYNEIRHITIGNYYIVPSYDTDYSDWYDTLYKFIMNDIGYSFNVIIEIMSNLKSLNAIHPNKNFSNSHTAMRGLIFENMPTNTTAKKVSVTTTPPQ